MKDIKEMVETDKRTIYIVALLCLFAILISGYFAFLYTPPLHTIPMMGTMREMMGWEPYQTQIYRSVFIVVVLASIILLGFLTLNYRMQRIVSITTPPEKKTDFLEIMPEDEKAILAPILDSPGLSQTEVVVISTYSKAKVSQVLSELENRGLIYREKDGKIYKVYPTKKILK